MASISVPAETAGVLVVHSCEQALAPHVEWALAHALGAPSRWEWRPQEILPGTLRTEHPWNGPVGTAARVASALHGWRHMRFEVTEEASLGTDGGRWLHTPTLGITHTPLDCAGNAVLTENRIRAILAAGGEDALRIQREVRNALGEPWDLELEPFRSGAAGVVWLHRAG